VISLPKGVAVGSPGLNDEGESVALAIVVAAEAGLNGEILVSALQAIMSNIAGMKIAIGIRHFVL
jgi:hypothetical protein